MNKSTLCLSSLLHKAAQPGLCPPFSSWQPFAAVDFIHSTPHLWAGSQHCNKSCPTASSGSIPSNMHHLSHSPVLHTFCGQTGTLCIKGRYFKLPLPAALPKFSLYVTAAPAIGRIRIKPQILPTPSRTISQLSTFYLWWVNWNIFIYLILLVLETGMI